LTPNPADPGLDPGRVYEKISVVKTRLALRVDPVKKKPIANPLTIFYFYQNDIILICKKN
jgi:hypothetical protein